MAYTKIKELADLLNSLEEDQRIELAQACDTSVGHLRNVCYGYKGCAHILAARLETYCKRRLGKHQKVYRYQLCPNDWREVWPELARKAPKVGA